VYGGLQDNGVWKGAFGAPENKAWHQTGQYPWKSIMGGDGMQVQIDSRDHNIVYTGYQFGNYFKLNLKTKEQTYIQPKHELGETPYRFNWQTPILLSPHNQDILYLGGNKLMRSMNQGRTFTAISEDLTNGGKKGNVAYGTLTTVSESPFKFGLIYTGSDDGLIYITKNAGETWKNISTNLPKTLWVSRVVASQHKKERVYATLNGYRFDDFQVYVYMSEDYGSTWKAIGTNIPTSPVNVIREDTENEHILYLGTDNGAYVSFNNGTDWDVFSKGLPNVAVHDIVIQPEAKHLLIGTHGRSIYQTDIAPLQQMSDAMRSQTTTLFKVNNINYSSRWGSAWSKWFEPYEPTLDVTYFSNSSEEKIMTIYSENNAVLNQTKLKSDQGYNYTTYDLTITNKGRRALLKEDSSIAINPAKNGKYYLPKGRYTIKIGDDKTSFEVQ
jgi:hypothetical protein